MLFSKFVTVITLQATCYICVFCLIKDNVLLTGQTFASLEHSSLYTCAAACLKKSACLSINFVKSSLECQLNSGDIGQFTKSSLTVYMDRKELHVKCFSTGRSSNAVLSSTSDYEEDRTGKVHQSVRGILQIDDNTSVWPIGATLPFECHDDAFSYKTNEITSSVNSQWSQNGCQRPGSCAELQVCNHSYGDGDYWLYPDIVGGERVKLFCSNMNTTHPKEYVSLAIENIGIYPNISYYQCTPQLPTGSPGSAVYTKIRLGIKTMEVNRWDYTFAAVEGTVVPYAEANDCYAEHENGQPNCGGPIGTFNVNLRGTGFVVHTNVTWIATGWNPYMIVEPSTDRSLVNLRCGGWCGGCEPVGPFILDFHSNKDVPYNSATEPTCKT